ADVRGRVRFVARVCLAIQRYRSTRNTPRDRAQLASTCRGVVRGAARCHNPRFVPVQRRSNCMFSCAFLCAVLALPAAQDAIRPDAVLLRMPDVSATEIVFRYANDLWLVDKRGGVARPLS